MGKIYKETPKFVDKLRTFGKVGVVLDFRKQKIEKNGQKRQNTLLCGIFHESCRGYIQDVQSKDRRNHDHKRYLLA